MKIAIHQPEHMPWLGFFDRMRQVDCYVILDHVQYRKRYFQNRNKIRTNGGEGWLNVPVSVSGKFDQRILEVKIDTTGNPRWREKWWQTLQHTYGKAPFWNDHAAFFQKTVAEKEWTNLRDLNKALIQYLFEAFGIGVEIRHSSDLGLTSAKSNLILDICKSVGASEYLSGISGKDYLDLPAFRAAGIPVRFQEFYHPIYRQMHEPFLPCMSAVDLLMNYGPESRHVLESGETPRLTHIIGA